MINKYKNISIIVIVLLGGAFLFYKSSSFLEQQRRLSLARELRKAVSATMLDLNQALSSSIVGVPADGQWHHAVSFNTRGSGSIQYILNGEQLYRGDARSKQLISAHVKEFNLKRDAAIPMIVDLKIVLKDGISLTSGSRVRLRE